MKAGQFAYHKTMLVFSVTYLYPFILDRIDRKWSEISHKVLDFDGDIRMITKATYLVRDFYLQEQPINFYTRHQIGDVSSLYFIQQYLLLGIL